MTPKEKAEESEDKYDGFLAHMESKGTSEPFKILSVDELKELMMSISLLESSNTRTKKRIR